MLQKAKRNFRKDYRGLCRSCCWQGMRICRRKVISPLAIICLGRILDGHQVVAHGDHREQNRDENRDGNQLYAAVLACGVFGTEPCCHQRNGQHNPRKIEKNFHAQADLILPAGEVCLPVFF